MATQGFLDGFGYLQLACLVQIQYDDGEWSSREVVECYDDSYVEIPRFIENKTNSILVNVPTTGTGAPR